MTTRHKISFILFAVFAVPLALFFGYYFAYEPLKFHRVISRTESARTPEEEREACALAGRCGRIWELNRLRPDELPDRARHLTGDWVLSWSGWSRRRGPDSLIERIVESSTQTTSRVYTGVMKSEASDRALQRTGPGVAVTVARSRESVH